MASVDFHCKCKGGTEAKAIMRHSDKEERAKPECKHDNPHLDKSKTHLNLAYKNISYAEAKLIYDKRILQLDATTNTNKRSDRVTMFGLEIPRPPKLKPQQYQRWFNRVCNLVEDWVGSDNFIEGYFHVDEVHDYYDPKEERWRTSVEHAHLTVIPEIDGKLNGKLFSSKSRMTALNNEIEKMTMKEFGVHFKTGKGKRGQTVEEMKQETAEAMKRMGKKLAQKEIELDAKSDRLDRELTEKKLELDKAYQKQVLDLREQFQNEVNAEVEFEVADRTRYLDDKERKLNSRSKSIDDREKRLEQEIDAFKGMDEVKVKRRWNYVQQHFPKTATQVEEAVTRIESNFNRAQRDLDLTTSDKDKVLSR